MTTDIHKQTRVVILAGGKGTRLMPYTTALPKPLMPVGDYPILEILLRQLANRGFVKITLAVGHLAALIQAYFKDGGDWGVELDYAYENTPLGTAGPIARLPREERAMLVLNGDLLTTMDFDHLVRFHQKNDAIATIATKQRTETVQFGVIDAAPDGKITQYREKPNLDYRVSMGIYVFSPAVRDYIPQSQKFDFPDLVQCLLENNQRVLAYPSDAYWLDIGRPDDYERANQDFPSMQSVLLGRREVVMDRSGRDIVSNYVEHAAVGTSI